MVTFNPLADGQKHCWANRISKEPLIYDGETPSCVVTGSPFFINEEGVGKPCNQAENAELESENERLRQQLEDLNGGSSRRLTDTNDRENPGGYSDDDFS